MNLQSLSSIERERENKKKKGKMSTTIFRARTDRKV